jgi:hypothetical protein
MVLRRPIETTRQPGLAPRVVPSKLPPEHRTKAFLLCDDCHVDAVVSLCQSHGMGIEIQSFFEPELPKENPQSILDHRQAISSLPLRSLHGRLLISAQVVFDIMMRNVARHRFDYPCDVAEIQNLDSRRSLGHRSHACK